MTTLEQERQARAVRVRRQVEANQIRMSALIELAMHNARLANDSGEEADIRARARADLRNAVARLETMQ